MRIYLNNAEIKTKKDFCEKTKNKKIYEIFLFRKDSKGKYDYTITSLYYTNKKEALKILKEEKNKNNDKNYDIDFNNSIDNEQIKNILDWLE